MKQKATIALFVVTIIWGWTFVWLKNALDASAEYTVGDQTNVVATLFVTLRFGLAAIKGVGIKSIKSMVDERKNNGKFNDVIDFMKRVNSEVINKRQLEKLIQSGSFDSLEKNRSKLFYNVPKFVELYGGERYIQNQNLSMQSIVMILP